MNHSAPVDVVKQMDDSLDEVKVCMARNDMRMKDDKDTVCRCNR